MTALPGALSGAGSVFALALVLRIGGILNSKGGPTGDFGYDQSVYYTAADALIHGRLPYRDFVLLHPPGLMLLLTPFAALGRLTTDLAGFDVANAALAVLGAVNAALVYRVARRMDLSRMASWLGGAFYAVWYGAVYSEMSARLEPLGNFALLCGLLALTRDDDGRRRRWTFVAGAAFGFALSVKVWWIAPFAVVLIWLIRTPGGLRRAAAFGAGAVATALIVDGPFFAVAPRAMFRMVISDQLGRHSIVPPLRRLASMTSLRADQPSMHGATEVAAAAVFVALLLALAVAAWRVAAARMLICIAAVQVGVLLNSPSFFHFYADYSAAPLALLVAAAAHSHRTRVLDRVATGAAAALVAAAAAITVSSVLLRPVGSIAPFPADQLAGPLPRIRCVMTVEPIVLIELNRLSTDLADHCANWVDVIGRTYDVDASTASRYEPRRRNAKWQHDARRYLLSGGVVVLVQNTAGLNAATVNAVRRNAQLLVQSGAYAEYRVRP